MLALGKYKNFFDKTKEEKELLYSQQKVITLEKDGNIAKYLGTKDLHLIVTIRNIIEYYNWAEHKKTRNQALSEEELSLINQKEITSKDENKTTSLKLMELVLEENKMVSLKPIELIEKKEELNKASPKVANFTTNELSRTTENQEASSE